MYTQIITITFLFAISLSVNLYRLDDHLFFSHEQGRDATAARGIYTLTDLTLIGPKTEIPGLFTPPWYYYLLAIPYGLSRGSPHFASFVQIILMSATAPIIYLLFHKLSVSNHWAFVAGIFTAFSFEFISYTRWLTNVSLAIPISALAFYFLISHCQTKSQKYLALYGILAVAASIFQVVLIFQFVFIWLVLTVLKITKLPQARALVFIAVAAVLVAAPLILFDFRNQHISANAAIDFLNGSSDYPFRFNPTNALSLYLQEFTTIAKRTLFNYHNPILLLTFAALLTFGLAQFAKTAKVRNLLVITATMTLMGLGIALFNIGLTQLYLATGIGLILLFTMAMQALWTNPKTRIAAVILSILWLVSLTKNLQLLDQNRGMFFVTIAEGLNYKDQKAALNFIRNDAAQQEYRLEAFTIPYLKPQGWEYLHQYFFGEGDNKTAKLVYIIIEKNVEQFWRQKWTEELGPTDLILSAKFNDITVEKRILKL